MDEYTIRHLDTWLNEQFHDESERSITVKGDRGIQVRGPRTARSTTRSEGEMMAQIIKCPECGKVILTRFPIHNCCVVVRFHVVPASTLRGWYVKRVVKIEGKETGDSWKEKHATKREAHAAKDTYNKQLQVAGTFEAIR